MKEQLLERFAPVLSEPAVELYGTLLAQVEEFTVLDYGEVVCRFPEEAGDWKILPPLAEPKTPTPAKLKRWRALEARVQTNAPADFAGFLAVCAGMEWGEVGATGQLVLGHGFGGTLDCLGEDALDEEECGFSYSPSLCSPIDIDLGDFYLFHPATGALCFQSEGSLEEVVNTRDPVEVYLRELHHELKDLGVDSPFRKAFAGAPHRSAWLQDCS